MTQLIPWIAAAIAAAAAVCFAAALFKVRRASRTARFLPEALGAERTCAFIVMGEGDRIPVYVSPSITALTGIDTDAIYSDVLALEWCLDEDAVRAGRVGVEKWLGGIPHTEEFDFKNIETNKRRHGKVTVSASDEYILMRIDEITHEIDIRDSLKRDLEQVKTEEKHKSDFLSNMSHEIRTPMNGIIGMLFIAKANIENEEEVLKCLEKANGLSQYLLSLINDILDMSKIESGKVELEHVCFDLYDVFCKVREMFAATIEQKGINFAADFGDVDSRYVLGDSLRLTQILTNMVSNAYKYTDGGGTIEFSFKQMHKTDSRVHILFRIKDTGKGMNPESLNRIFKPFEQESASTARKFGGTGLGMSIADNLVTLMGGHIVVDTAPGKGTDFSVFIPFDEADAEQIAEIAHETDTTTAAQSGGGKRRAMRVLMAEDNAINAEIGVELLRMEGVQTDTAQNGLIAVELFKKSAPYYYDLILMDVQMPEMDGWSATKEIRAINSDYAQTIPIYALSANAYVEDMRHSVEMGMNGHLSKPIDMARLCEVLDEAAAMNGRIG